MASIQFKVENYPQNSFIIVEGKKNAQTFFIIRNGKVKIIKDDPVVNEEAHSILGPGDFFGVISCMSGHARMESVVALSNLSLISVEKDQFGILIQKNPIVALKIIRFFSRKLRDFNQAITRLTLKNTVEEDPEHLFNIGEYYYRKNVQNHSIYAYQKYIHYSPNGPNRDAALSRLKSMKSPFMVKGNQLNDIHRTYNDNTMIFCENEPGDELYIIQSGKVKITKIVDEEVLLAVLNPGDIFGEMALLDNRPRSASAITFGKVTLLAINKANFEEMVSSQPQLITKIIQLLSERIWTAYRQLENLMIKDLLGRIYDTLLIQIEKKKIKIVSKESYNFEFGAKELLNMVGLPQNKGNVLINQLLEDKHITLEEGKIICTDMFELEKTVHFYKKKSALERKREEGKSI
ncbi:MAG: cyclic nucleotide-binding domain-containing protein [Spirochaetota bacterium]|nr:cyclic nucleotide-binding domain-containing protein [Spirochaetota bacterium]